MRTQALRVALLAVVASAGLVAAGVPPAAASHAATVTAAPRVRLSLHSGPPTSTVKVSGTGFGAYRAVDIYFDTTDEALASTNGNGAFNGIAIGVPAAAVPGTHYITAVQRHTGRSAQARFLVNTNWAQFHYSDNIYALNAATGTELWRYPIEGGVDSPPAVANGVVYVGSFNGNMYAFRLASGQAAPGRPAPGQLHPNYALRAHNGTGA